MREVSQDIVNGITRESKYFLESWNLCEGEFDFVQDAEWAARLKKKGFKPADVANWLNADPTDRIKSDIFDFMDGVVGIGDSLKVLAKKDSELSKAIKMATKASDMLYAAMKKYPWG